MIGGNHITSAASTSARQGATPTEIVTAAFDGLSETSSRDDISAGLRRLVHELRARDELDRAAAKQLARDRLKAMDIGAQDSQQLVSAAFLDTNGNRSSPDVLQGSAVRLTDPEPWPEEVDGAVLLEEIEAAIRRYVVLSDAAAVVVTLWVLMTYCITRVPVAVRLILTSPTKECGKTRILTLLWALVRRALSASSISPAFFYRVIESIEPTLLMDEVDNARLNDNDELRGLLNSGHTRGTAYALRTVGDAHEPRAFSTWCAVALAAIGNLPDTVTSRGIILRQERKAPDVSVARLREARLYTELEPLRRRATRWAADHGSALEHADPDLPRVLDGRAADNWAVMIAIAELAGGNWPDRARLAAVTLARAVEQDNDQSIMLLSDLRDLFDERHVDRLGSAEIVKRLAEQEHRPWPEWKHGKAITTIQLARLLKRFEITPRSLNLGGTERPKGYLREHFEEAWVRYLSRSSEQGVRLDGSVETVPAPEAGPRGVENGPEAAAERAPTRYASEQVAARAVGVAPRVACRDRHEAARFADGSGVADRKAGHGVVLLPQDGPADHSGPKSGALDANWPPTVSAPAVFEQIEFRGANATPKGTGEILALDALLQRHGWESIRPAELPSNPVSEGRRVRNVGWKRR